MRTRIIPAVPEKTVQEEMISMTVDFNSEIISLIMGELDSDGKVVSHRVVNLDQQAYGMLMAESPEWAKGKPANDFRRTDVVKVMDLLGIQ
jgi:hypothetical protein